MQAKKELEQWYKGIDPWGYTSTQDDFDRRTYITETANQYSPERVLDIGAGEGFITKLLKSNNIEAIELSDKAASRLPENVKRVKKPAGKYDMILACGVLYEHYDYESMIDIIKKHANKYVLTCHYDQIGVCHDKLDYKQIFYAESPYREGKQIMRVYDVRLS